MKVLLTTPGYPPTIGGVERHVAQLATGLQLAGEAVTVVVQDRWGVMTSPSDDAVRRHRSVVPGAVFPVAPGVLRDVRRLRGLVDVAHSHNLHSAVPLLTAAGLPPCPVVVTPHFHGGGHTPAAGLAHRAYRPLAGRLLQSAHAVIAVSAAERDLLLDAFALPPTRVHVVPNGTGSTQPAGERAVGVLPYALVVGRLEPHKRVPDAVRALLAVPDLRVVVVGSGPDRPQLAQLQQQVSGRLELRQDLTEDQLQALRAQAAVVVSLSRDEAFGLTVLEALSDGVRVVISDIPAHREVADQFRGGVRLVALDAGTADVADAVTAVMTGRAPERTQRAWTWEDCAAAVRDVYAQVLSATGKQVQHDVR